MRADRQRERERPREGGTLMDTLGWKEENNDVSGCALCSKRGCTRHDVSGGKKKPVLGHQEKETGVPFVKAAERGPRGCTRRQ